MIATLPDRSLTVMADGEPFPFSGRMRLRGEDELSLFPALFTLELWNLPEEYALRLFRCRRISVSHGDACLVSGAVPDVFRHPEKEGVVTTVAISLGLDLWESLVSLTVPAGTSLPETARRILSASGTGIRLLGVGDGSSRPIVLPRAQSFFGRASECIATVLTCHSDRSESPPRAMLTPSGLMIVPAGGLPEAVRITETDLTDAPVFAGGALHGSPSLMILSAAVSGWRPGQTVEVDYPDVHARGIITERGVDADTASGPWKSEMIVELV